MSDTNTTPTPSGKSAAQGFILLTLLIFCAFIVAGLGWHVGVALARVLGL